MTTLRAILVAGAAAGALLGSMATAGAAPRGYTIYNGLFATPAYPPARGVFAAPARKQKSEPKKEIGFGEMPKGPMQIVVSIHTQRVTLYSNGQRVAQGPVSTGVPGHPTPLGVFSVIEKDRHHHSNIYSGAPMPFMQRITWSGVALHEGVLPGYPASHGCIRMSHDFAQKLWPITKLGVRVVVARDDLAPRDFEHPKLFVPKAKPADQVAATEILVRMAQASPSDNIATDASEPAIEGNRLLAREPKSEPTSEPRASQRASRAARSPPARPPTSRLRPRTSRSRPRVRRHPPPPIRPGPFLQGLRPRRRPPSTSCARRWRCRRSLRRRCPLRRPAAADDPKPAPTIDPPKPTVPPRIKSVDQQPVKRGGQVAVFVSRKEKKIFVRQGFIPLFDMPVTIDEPDQPLGTHVFTAMGGTDDGAGMRWNLITVPSDTSPAVERKAAESRQLGRKPAKEQALAVRPMAHLKPPSTAAQALDRVQMPPEAVERIAELLIPGSSLVISDEGLGKETGRYTEFIVLTR